MVKQTLKRIGIALTAVNALWIFLGFGFIALPFPHARWVGILLIALIFIVAIIRIWVNYFKGEEILKGLHFKKEEFL